MTLEVLSGLLLIIFSFFIGYILSQIFCHFEIVKIRAETMSEKREFFGAGVEYGRLKANVSTNVDTTALADALATRLDNLLIAIDEHFDHYTLEEIPEIQEAQMALSKYRQVIDTLSKGE